MQQRHFASVCDDRDSSHDNGKNDECCGVHFVSGKTLIQCCIRIRNGNRSDFRKTDLLRTPLAKAA